MYVNGAHEDVSTELGKLVHDLSCKSPDEMYNGILADRVRTFKETDGGERHMGPVFEKFKDEITAEVTAEVSESKQIEIATRLILRGRDSVDEISEMTGLSKEKVLELMQPAAV